MLFLQLMYLFIFHFKSQPKAFSTMELINLDSIISTSPIISFSSSKSKMIASKAFTKDKNLVRGTLGLTIGSYFITNSAITI